ncbi:MAG: peptidylprolyl isomerase [Proteobacteria bacterium]|nr:peptidylprolyl isomerase [Pseudomonadota bacterium]
MSEADDPQARRRVTALLAIAAALGLGLAATGLLTGVPDDGDGLPEGSVARVNDVLIRAEKFERLVAGLESDTRQPVDERARRHVLDRMIDEELLVQRGLALGLPQVDRRVRADLTSALIDSVVSSVEDRDPAEGELAAFFEVHRDFFTRPGRARVRQIFFRARDAAEEARSRASAAEARRRLLDGEPFEVVRKELGDVEISPVPDAYLPATKLREYLGPTALRSALDLEVGEIGEPVRSGTGVHLIQLVGREPRRVPDLEQALPQVRAEWKRRLGDDALRAYLDDLREDAQVVTASSLNGQE